MKIAVVGSNGRTGREVLEQGIRRGHTITAFTRHPEELAGIEGLEAIVQGDGLKLEDLRKVVQGQDAVISAIGSEAITCNIIAAMQESGVRRLVCTSAYPVTATASTLIVRIVKWVLRKAYAELAVMEQEVMTSGLDWTIVRPTRLNNGPATGRVRRERVKTDFASGPMSVRRADLATVLLDEAEDSKAIKTAVAVTGA